MGNLELKPQIENKDGQLVVSSRIIAQQLNKRHDNVLRDLDTILETSNLSSLILSSTYEVEGQSRKYKEYLLTRDGFTLYMFNIQGYNEFKIAYINKFNEMEKQLQIMSPLDILKHQVFIMEQQEKRLKEVEDKLLLVESKLSTKDESYFTITGYANLVKRRVDKLLALKLGRQCSSVCNTRKLHIGKEYDAKYGQVNTYPKSILEEVFNSYFSF